LLTQPKKQVAFLATSDVSTYSQKGLIFPATGAITAPIIHSTNRKPIIVGKPDPSALECIKELFPLDPNRTCMIGDR
jgi:4-nitrophenyl phosphatase